MHNKPSSFYRTEFWSVGVQLARWLPARLFDRLIHAVSTAYWTLNKRRREVVIQNLLPAVVHRETAEKQSQLLFRNFAQKVADLWRYESGSNIDSLFRDWSGWEHYEAAKSVGRGILLLTPHLGNWEFGAPLLARKGEKLLVITMAEPQSRLTSARQAARARWGIETLVIGRDPFAFVEIIRRLEAGATVALLVDRPPETSATVVELFGKPFSASVAAAELARASGCTLLPVYLPRHPDGYTAHMLPRIQYDRRALGQREARHKLTQEILRAFEPVIQQYISQWYHFVPLWNR